ncbi:MAG: hypothetical protein HC856_03950 [Pseudanabaena sp. RU_4_16]|nr:hypothetical protein [Pseudanabaena sp. RU_4_16]
MSSTYQKTEPFLLIHIALLAAVPFVMVLCIMGLAVGDPVLPGWLEMIILGFTSHCTNCMDTVAEAALSV